MENCDLNEFLSVDTIDISGRRFNDKNDLFAFMTEILFHANCINDRQAFMDALYEREKTGSTYMGNGLAVPHGKSISVLRPSIAFCRCSPFKYDKDEDDETTQIVLMLAIPESTEQSEYINLLAQVSMLFVDEEFLEIVNTEQDKRIILDEFYNRLLKVK